MNRLRVGCLQWKFGNFATSEAFWDECEWQIRTAKEDYRVQLLVLPEYLAADHPGDWPSHEIWTTRLLHLSKELNLWIVGGSLPFADATGLFNRCWITGPQGQLHHQDKLHITPWEKQTWQMLGGSACKIIDIGHCRIAVAICYDVEFPEQIRAYADAGAELICVPYCTDDAQGHHRVTLCARARAIENTVYIAAAGCVGTLRTRAGFAHHYASSLVATPCDIGYPSAGLAIQADPGSAQCLIAELDLAQLRNTRQNGTVLPLLDRRKDLFHP